jgi:hypothetical protein
MTRSFSSPGAALFLAAALAAACGGGSQGPGGQPTPIEQGGGSAPAPGSQPTPVEQRRAPAPGRELTTAEEVLEASLAAQGGREQIGKIKALRQTGKLAFVEMGMKGSVTIIAAAPRSNLLVLDMPGMGKMLRGLSGDVGWELSAMAGARVLAGPELAQMMRESTFNADLIWKQLYPKVVLAGVAEFAGQQAYKIVMTAVDGDTQTRYFAKDTLLPIGIDKIAKSQMGDIPGVEIHSDWRDVGGIKYPHKVQIKQGPQTLEVVVEKIEIDPQLDPSTFALPPEIAALQQKPADAPKKPADTPKKPADAPKR